MAAGSIPVDGANFMCYHACMTRVEALQILQVTEAQMTVGDNWREIVDPNFYERAGWPQNWVASITKNHKPNNENVAGVWHPDFLKALCSSLEISEKEYAEIPGVAAQCRKMAVLIWLEIREGEGNEKN